MWFILFFGMAWYVGEDIYRTVKERRQWMALRIVNYVGISKNSSHDEVTVLFPSYVTKFLRIGATMRADFCLVCRKNSSPLAAR